MEKYDNNGKGRYIQLDDNKMSYEYLSITLTEMGQFSTYNHTYCKENKECNQDTFLDTLHLRHILNRIYPISIYAL